MNNKLCKSYNSTANLIKRSFSLFSKVINRSVNKQFYADTDLVLMISYHTNKQSLTFEINSLCYVNEVK